MRARGMHPYRNMIVFGLSTWLALPACAMAQDITRTTPLLDEGNDDYKPVGIALGRARLLPSADIRLAYDDNIYATSSNTKDDAIVTVAPQVVVDYDGSSVHLTGTASAELRRFASRKAENSNAGLIEGTAAFKISNTDRIIAALRAERFVEDRGDPEARAITIIGPRRGNVWGGALEYNRVGRRIGLRANIDVKKFDFLSALDDERDLTQYAASGRISVRLRGQASLFGQVFANRRDYRLATDTSGVNRDSDTYGARAGIQIDPGGQWRGDAGVGLFRFDPKDNLLNARTGFSVSAGLVYQPRKRVAITLDAFRGDVATVLSGASTRVDTRLRLGVQQEVRRNLRWQSALIYRKSSFIGAGQERTLGGMFEVEYLINRRLSIAATANYADRNSSTVSKRFERFRGGLELRLQY